jgi:hypothetical protein
MSLFMKAIDERLDYESIWARPDVYLHNVSFGVESQS